MKHPRPSNMLSPTLRWIHAPGSLAAFLVSLALGAGFLGAAPQALLLGDDAEEDEDEEEEEQWFAIVGGDVYTGTGALLRSATVLSRNGVIEDIGYDLFIPEDAERLDATGMRVYPGMVALSATGRISSGLFSSEEVLMEEAAGAPQAEDDDEPRDSHYGLDEWISWAYGDNEEADPAAHAHLEGEDFERSSEPLRVGDAQKIQDGFDPFSQYLVLALASGITTAEQSGAALKLRRGEIDGVVMNEKSLRSVNWSLNNPSSIADLREKYAVTAGYLREYRAWEQLSDKERKEVKEPKKPRGFDSTTFDILRGNALARFNANGREDLLGIARFAQQYGFRPVIWGCQEGWTVAQELGRAGAFAVLSPRNRNPKNERLRRPGGTSIENAAILHAHGVQVAIVPESNSFDMSGITGRDLMHLPVEAAFGVRGGLPEDAAFAAISLVPARLLGVDHRVGTLEVGKDMDAIVTDGDILHYQTFVQWAVVAGELVYDKQEELFFAHIRPRPERAPAEPQTEPEAAEDDEASGPGDESDDESGEESDDEADDEPGEGSESEDEDSDSEER